MLKTLRWCFIGLCMVFALAHAVPVLVTDGAGKLLGADGVLVDGNLYDARFLDGSCASLFSGCDADTDFQFASAAAADLASQALLDQVLVGLFDAQPDQTNGCANVAACSVLTPYGTAPFLGLVSNAFNSNIDAGDGVFGGGAMPFELDSACCDNIVYTIWTPAAVPLPGTLSCLGLGLLALALANRRRALPRCRIP